MKSSRSSLLHLIKTIPCKEVHTWYLIFHDKELETIYREETQVYQKKILLILIVYLNLCSILLWLMYWKFQVSFDTKSLVITLLNLLLIPTFAIIIRRKPALIQNFLIIIILFMLFATIGIERIHQEKIDITEAFYMGFFSEIICFISILAKICWRLQILLYLIQNFLISLILIGIENNKIHDFLPLSFCFLNFCFLANVSYMIQHCERRWFFEIKKQEQSLVLFQTLIEDVLPLGVVITAGDTILFQNNEFERILKMTAAQGPINFESFKEIQLFQMTRNNENHDILSSVNKEVSPTFKEINLNEMLKNEKKGADITKFSSYKGAIFSANRESVEKYLSVKSSFIIWSDQKAKITLISEDNSELRIQLLKQREAEKDVFLASISHELRTPLNCIIGMIKLTEESTQNVYQRESLSLALTSSYHLLSLINDILDYTQISLGKFRLRLSHFHPDEVIQEVSNLINTQAIQKGIGFIVENKTTRNAQELTFYNDPTRLKQILMNLLGNSLKFTRKGFVKIIYEVIPLSPDTRSPRNRNPCSNKLLLCTIEDSGCGIKAKNIKNLFRGFGKTEDSESAKISAQGLGLGLAISQRLLKIMNEPFERGKEITVESHLGKGSRFTFEIYSHDHEENRSLFDSQGDDDALSVSEEEAENLLSPVRKVRLSKFFRSVSYIKKGSYTDIVLENETNVKTIGRKKKILLVDDDEMNIIIGSRYLSHYKDLEYDCAKNGAEAIDLVNAAAATENTFYDLILMDCNMPVMNGFDASLEINSMISQGKIPSINIVAVTADVLPSDLDRCLRCGMIDYLTKPFTREELRSKVDLHMRKMI